VRSRSSHSPPARRGRQRGQALVEFAFGFTVLMIILAGLLDISQAFQFAIGLEGAARAGARHGVFYNSPTKQNPFLDDADIKAAADTVLLGSGFTTSTLKSTGGCLVPTDANAWVNPPFAAAAYPPALNTPWLYICYDTQGALKAGSKLTPPAVGDSSYRGTDLSVVIVARYGLIGGLGTQYLKTGASLTSIQLVGTQHFSVQG
jgi:Flp pilus assembly protein TadG